MPQALPVDAPSRRRLPPLLRRAWFGLNQAFRRRIRHLHLTPDQFTVLRTLLEQDGISQKNLTTLMASDPNTIASLLERMEASQLLRRVPHELDRRARRLHLTAVGRRQYHLARAIAQRLQTEILAVLPSARREPFLAHLTLVADACQMACEASPRKRPRSI